MKLIGELVEILVIERKVVMLCDWAPTSIRRRGRWSLLGDLEEGLRRQRVALVRGIRWKRLEGASVKLAGIDDIRWSSTWSGYDRTGDFSVWDRCRGGEALCDCVGMRGVLRTTVFRSPYDEERTGLTKQLDPRFTLELHVEIEGSMLLKVRM